jgi:hypothetical protein
LTTEAPRVRPMAEASEFDFVRLFSSPALNSRTLGSGNDRPLKLRWEAPLTSQSFAVLLSGGRVLVQRGGGWTLFDRTGKQIAEDTAGAAAMTVDRRAGQFYSTATGNVLRAHAIDDGELRFSVPLGYNEAFAWPLLYRSGKRLIAAATEQKMFSPKNYPPTRSLIQIIEPESPPRLSPYKVLVSIDAQQDLIFKDPKMLPVASGDTIWAALPNLLVRTSASQEIAGAWRDTFEPVLASADEAGWLHLIATVGERRELWVVTSEGKRTIRMELPNEFHELIGPPAIGYDHSIYVWTARTIGAFSHEGKPLWNSSLDGPIRGLGVTAAGNVLVAAGQQVHVIGRDGKASELVKLAEPATTPPVMTAEGDLIVGGATKLMYFSPLK